MGGEGVLSAHPDRVNRPIGSVIPYTRVEPGAVKRLSNRHGRDRVETLRRATNYGAPDPYRRSS